jgi:cell shape-determining protein MreC
MRDIRRRLQDLKKENDELKQMLSISGKQRQDYESKVNLSITNRSECFLFIIDK